MTKSQISSFGHTKDVGCHGRRLYSVDDPVQQESKNWIARGRMDDMLIDAFVFGWIFVLVSFGRVS